MNSHYETRRERAELFSAINENRSEDAIRFINRRTINLSVDLQSSKTALIIVAGKKPNLKILSYILAQQSDFDPSQGAQMNTAVREALHHYLNAHGAELQSVYRNILATLLSHTVYHSPLSSCKLINLDVYMVHYRQIDRSKDSVLNLYEQIYLYGLPRSYKSYTDQGPTKLNRQIKISGYFTALECEDAARAWYVMGMNTSLELMDAGILLKTGYYLDVLKEIVNCYENPWKGGSPAIITPRNAYTAALLIGQHYLKFHHQPNADITHLKYFNSAYQIATKHELQIPEGSRQFLKIFFKNKLYSILVEPNDQSMGISKIFESLVDLQEVLPYPSVEANLLLKMMLSFTILPFNLMAYYLTEINEKHISEDAKQQLHKHESEVVAMMNLFGFDLQINQRLAFSMYKELGDKLALSDPKRAFNAYVMSMIGLQKCLQGVSSHQQAELITHAKQISTAMRAAYTPDESVHSVIEIFTILFELCKLLELNNTPTKQPDKHQILQIIMSLFVKVVDTYSSTQRLQFEKFAVYVLTQMLASGLLEKRFNSELYVNSIASCIRKNNDVKRGILLWRQLTQLCDYAVKEKLQSLEFNVKKNSIELLAQSKELKNLATYDDAQKAQIYLEDVVKFQAEIDDPLYIKKYLSLYHLKGVLSSNTKEQYQAFRQAINLGSSESIVNVIAMQHMIVADKLIALFNQALKNAFFPIDHQALVAIYTCLQANREKFLHNTLEIHAFARFELRAYLANQLANSKLSSLIVDHNYLPAMLQLWQECGGKLSNKALYLSIRILAELNLHGDILVDKFGLTEQYRLNLIEMQLEFLSKAKVNGDNKFISLSEWYLSFHQAMVRLLAQKRESYLGLGPKMPNFNVDTLLLQADKDARINESLRSGMQQALNVDKKYLEKLADKAESSTEKVHLSHAEVRNLLPKESITQAIMDKKKAHDSDYDADGLVIELKEMTSIKLLQISESPHSLFAHSQAEEMKNECLSEKFRSSLNLISNSY